ncbi:aldo/keto reductase [Isoptericola sp. 4D.3]|jgi:aryl-alcohol dehydrogenase-like predicted oxidoreductase|uniref:Aldo/keto reductase n=1 Tax=Isoptericola peretonis TaxID=2918523 RepID=A0ABT0J381_9MICO|nr:aldo/keto reductase [Isoptericola sp. 4D.3]
MTTTTGTPRTTLGDGLETSLLGYGAMGLAQVYGAVDEDDALATLHHVVDVGIDLVDTADLYGQGSNERLVGRLLADRRDEVTLATKFGIVPEDDTYTRMSARNDPAYAAEAVDASLHRLGVDVIDLYYLHRRDPRVPVEDVVGAMADLVRAGKVRHLGLSEVTAAELRAAQAVHPIAAVQSEWSLWSRDVERAVVPAAAELGVGFVPYSPLSRGFLAGGLAGAGSLVGDWRSNLERFRGSAFEANQALVAVVRGIAEERGATPAQVALAWLRHQGEALGLPVVPIPGSRRAARVDENLASLALTLDAEALAALGELADGVVGARSDRSDPDWVSDTRE